MKVKDLVELVKNKVDIVRIEKSTGGFIHYCSEETDNADVLQINFFYEHHDNQVFEIANIYIY